MKSNQCQKCVLQRSKMHAFYTFLTRAWILLILRTKPFLGPVHTCPYIFLIRNFFFPDTASVHTYPVNPAYISATFWICSPEYLNTLWIRNRVNAKSGYFLSGDLTRLSPVLYREYYIQHDNLAPKFSLLLVFTTHALLPTPRGVLGTD